MIEHQRTYTLILASAAGSRFYKIVLNGWQLCVYAICCLVAVFMVVGLFISYYSVQEKYLEIREKHQTTVKTLQSRLVSVEAESEQVRQMAEEIGLLLDEASMTAGESPADGVGGASELESLTRELDQVAAKLGLLRRNLYSEKTCLATTPIGWPVFGRVTSDYGARHDPFSGAIESHAGVDLGASYGSSVQATADGLVIYAGSRGGYGNLVVIDHGGRIRTLYAHLAQMSVEVGDRVKRGDQIGRLGRTGRATAPHVHYEVRVKDRPVNPHQFMSAQ